MLYRISIEDGTLKEDSWTATALNAILRSLEEPSVEFCPDSESALLPELRRAASIG